MSSPIQFFRERFDVLQRNIELVIRGKSETVRLALTCLFAGGHLLIEDVPGVAKTSLAKAIARSIEGGEFKRIQFTPDLLPADLTGGEVYDPRSGTFEFRPGPVFTHVLLGDEINRASPRTQSALLQVMAESEVSVGTLTRPAPNPFFCVATQNPIEYQGTYPLPEAQLDRFLMRIPVGYPGHHDEMDVISLAIAGAQASAVNPVVTLPEMIDLIGITRQVSVGDALRDYIVRIVQATRPSTDDPTIRLGVSPRGSIALARAAQVVAASHGRSFAAPDDVKAVAHPVLEHRILLTPEARMREMTTEKVLAEILGSVPVPRRP